MSSRKKPGLAFWATVVVVVVVLYPLSFGPATRLMVALQGNVPYWAKRSHQFSYWPIVTLNRQSKTAYSVSHWYLQLWGVNDRKIAPGDILGPEVKWNP